MLMNRNNQLREFILGKENICFYTNCVELSKYLEVILKNSPPKFEHILLFKFEKIEYLIIFLY